MDDRQPESGQRVTPLELFFDLVFVFAITTQVSQDNARVAGVGLVGRQQDPTLYRLTFTRAFPLPALFLAIGHHIDHVLRGNAVGWPLTDEVNGFTASLSIYRSS
jgi:hypothetical protein